MINTSEGKWIVDRCDEVMIETAGYDGGYFGLLHGLTEC